MKRKKLAALSALAVAASVLTASVTTAHAATASDSSHASFDAVYVVNGGDGENSSISVIDTERNRVATTIELPGVAWPHHIYLSPDRSTLAVAVPGMDLSMGHEQPPTPGPGAVLIFDAKANELIDSRVLPARNHNAIYSPDGREIWTSQMMGAVNPGTVLVLDAGSLETKATIPAGVMPHEVTFSPWGGSVYVANAFSNNVMVIDPSTRQVVNTIPVGDLPVGPWQGNNGFVYVDEEHSQSVSAISRRSQRVTHTYDLGFTPGMAQLGPDRLLWVSDSTNGQVVLFSPYRDQRVAAIPTGTGAHAIAFSPDGRTAYITNQLANTVSAIDIRSHTVKATINVGEKPNGMVARRG
jgi:YVTN family beta-propeller protein